MVPARRTWLRAEIHAATECLDIASGALWEAGAIGVLEQAAKPGQVALTAWWPEEEDRAAVAPRIEHLGPVRWGTTEEEDWAEGWRDRFRPLRFGRRIVVAPPWDVPAVGPEVAVVLVEPGLAFGTGEHATTRFCLEAVDRIAVAGQTCLDVGCGSGVLALAAAALGMDALGIDLDPAAVRAARENAERSGSRARFEGRPLAEIRDTFDLVLANLTADAIVDLADDLVRTTLGRLVLSGILVEQESAVAARFSALEPAGRVSDGEWVALEFQDP